MRNTTHETIPPTRVASDAAAYVCLCIIISTDLVG